ncbi:MAG: hypothetical protein IPM46_14445 [Flavobacteriales bacterium]|nr:hypothetical protein [Flavobacteriales bacterium]
MKRTSCFALVALLAAAVLLAELPVFGQSALDSDRTIVVQVEGLTAQDRDALQQEVKSHPGLELSFACVPAGILVFSSAPGVPKAVLRERAMPLISTRASSNRITELDYNLARAEETCAEARNR